MHKAVQRSGSWRRYAQVPVCKSEPTARAGSAYNLCTRSTVIPWLGTVPPTKRIFEMIFDVLTVLFLFLGFSLLTRLIGRRRGDVLYYVSNNTTRSFLTRAHPHVPRLHIEVGMTDDQLFDSLTRSTKSTGVPFLRFFASQPASQLVRRTQP
jgi:hypothetical protein